MMARRTNNIIRKQHLILCEGRDAEEFLIKYLNSQPLSDTAGFANDIQVMDFGGNENLSNYMTLLKNMEGFNQVESLMVIRDAERDAENAVYRIKAAFRNNGLPIPDQPHKWTEGALKTGFLLFPTCGEKIKNGTLEDLCLSVLSEDNSLQVLGDIQLFMDELGSKHGRIYPHEFKTKLHTYFSVTDAYVSMKIGEAAAAGAFLWDSEKLQPLKEFIGELF